MANIKISAGADVVISKSAVVAVPVVAISRVEVVPVVTPPVRIKATVTVTV